MTAWARDINERLHRVKRGLSADEIPHVMALATAVGEVARSRRRGDVEIAHRWRELAEHLLESLEGRCRS